MSGSNNTECGPPVSPSYPTPPPDTNDSSTGGYVQPQGTPPLEDAALDAVLQGMVVGVTNLPGQLVRPRWQPVPPSQPSPSTNWCAIGAIQRDPLDYPENRYQQGAAPDGSQDTILQLFQEELECLASFYGPNCNGIASQFRSAMYIRQNWETLEAQGIALKTFGSVTHVPELVNTQWLQRCDLPFTLRRVLQRTYPVRPIATVLPPTITYEP